MEEIQHITAGCKFFELLKGHEQRAREGFVLGEEEEACERMQSQLLAAAEGTGRNALAGGKHSPAFSPPQEKPHQSQVIASFWLTRISTWYTSAFHQANPP